MTDAERRLWHFLRGRRLEGAKYQSVSSPSVPMWPISPAGRRISSSNWMVASIARRLTPRGRRSLKSFGYRIIRFWNNDVLQNTDGVLEAIRQELLNAIIDRPS